MPTRRYLLAATAVGATGTLTGCLNALGDDDDLSDEEQELLQQYQTAYDHHKEALNSLERGFDAYDNEQYSRAVDHFRDAETDFDRTESFYGIDQIELYATVFGEETPLAHEEARNAISFANTQILSLINWVAFVEERGEPTPATSGPISDIRSDFQQGQFDMPTPNQFENAVEDL